MGAICFEDERRLKIVKQQREDAFKHYVKELSQSRFDPLSAAEEREFLALYKKGSQKALDRLIESHLRFVMYVLKEFEIPQNVGIMDIIQEGNLGVIEGIKKYDGDRFENRMFTYVVYYIRWYIARFLNVECRIFNKFIFVGDDEQEQSGEEGYRTRGREYLLTETQREVVTADILTLVERDLDPRELFIVKAYFGFGGESPKTLREIGATLQVELQRVKQIKNQALKKINNETTRELYE